jgi:mono/diheme cytochrome c family protein
MKIALVIAIGFLFVGFVVVDAAREPQSFEAATYYKKNCEECHGAAAEKRFNPDSPESQMIDSILNGAKAEGSRDMPAYSEKGIDEPKAKALITYMKSIRE